jgi:hypothetical protein
MSTSLSSAQAAKLGMLLNALDGVAISDAERASLKWLSGFEAHTVSNISAVISRARAATNETTFRTG